MRRLITAEEFSESTLEFSLAVVPSTQASDAASPEPLSYKLCRFSILWEMKDLYLINLNLSC
jgi:hypothetical protein